jgi:polyisoprenoid-binding protein YceI
MTRTIAARPARRVAVPAQPRKGLPESACAAIRSGRWVIDPERSHLKVSVKVGLFTICGRFADVNGFVEVGADHAESTVSVTVATESLTSGSGTMDAMLRGAGVIDTVKNPTIAFDSHELRYTGKGYELRGILVTNGGVLEVTYELEEPEFVDADSLVIRARGALASKDAVRLLSCAGMDRVLGKSMGLDLLLTVTRD